MHQPDTEYQIETTVDGEHVRGTVRLGGSTDLSVRLESPSSVPSVSWHMPYFARGVHRDGFLGEYGDQYAMEVLVELYKEQKRGNRRREYAGIDYEEFGRVRFLLDDPRYPRRDRIVLGQAPVNDAVEVRLEDRAPYRLARFYDAATREPFLAEAAVYEEHVQEYVEGTISDLGFRHRLESTRQRLTPDMVRYAEMRASYQVTPYQIDFLRQFARLWRAGDVPLDTAEIDHLMERGYLTRSLGNCPAERASLEAAIERRMESVKRLEAAGQEAKAEQCRAKIRKLQLRIDAKTLCITAAGKSVGENFPCQVLD